MSSDSLEASHSSPLRNERLAATLTLLLSLLLHVGVIIFLSFMLRAQPEEPQERAMEVDVIPAPTHTKPPEPKPATPKTETPRPPPPAPQLQRGTVAEHSSAGGQSQKTGPSGETMVKPTPVAPLSLQRTTTNGSGKSGGPFGSPALSPVTQTEHDFILAQVIDKWRFNYTAPEGRDLVLYAMITINADGTLGSPMNRADPWNPAGIMPGYAQTSPYVKAAVDSFLLALRLAQSFELPPDGHWPKKMQIEFRFRDLHLQ